LLNHRFTVTGAGLALRFNPLHTTSKSIAIVQLKVGKNKALSRIAVKKGVFCMSFPLVSYIYHVYKMKKNVVLFLKTLYIIYNLVFTKGE